MSENRLHAVLLAVFVAFAGATFVDAFREDAAREAAASQARAMRVAWAAPAAPAPRR